VPRQVWIRTAFAVLQALKMLDEVSSGARNCRQILQLDGGATKPLKQIQWLA
jgi:hypothetical protein